MQFIEKDVYSFPYQCYVRMARYLLVVRCYSKGSEINWVSSLKQECNPHTLQMHAKITTY
jgi:hypothetical protein